MFSVLLNFYSYTNFALFSLWSRYKSSYKRHWMHITSLKIFSYENFRSQYHRSNQFASIEPENVRILLASTSSRAEWTLGPLERTGVLKWWKKNTKCSQCTVKLLMCSCLVESYEYMNVRPVIRCFLSRNFFKLSSNRYIVTFVEINTPSRGCVRCLKKLFFANFV